MYGNKFVYLLGSYKEFIVVSGFGLKRNFVYFLINLVNGGFIGVV